MSFKRLEELPISVKDLPVLAQKMWMRSSNRAIKSYPQSRAYEIAWTVVKQFYKRTPKGTWVRRK